MYKWSQSKNPEVKVFNFGMEHLYFINNPIEGPLPQMIDSFPVSLTPGLTYSPVSLISAKNLSQVTLETSTA
jgi:hypothetical protein